MNSTAFFNLLQALTVSFGPYLLALALIGFYAIKDARATAKRTKAARKTNRDAFNAQHGAFFEGWGKTVSTVSVHNGQIIESTTSANARPAFDFSDFDQMNPTN